MRKLNTIKLRGKDLLFYACLLILWQAVYWLGVTVFGVWKSYSFPNPVSVAESLFRLFYDGNMLLAVAYSLKRVGIGFLFSLLAGVAFGMAVTKSAYLKRNLKPLLVGIQSLPSICWVPFAILWFGLKEGAIIFVVFMGTVFSVSLAVEDAINTIPPIFIKTAKTMGADRASLFSGVILPAALPQFVAGLKHSWSFAWRALMSGEVLSSCVGLGYTLMIGRDMADINQVMAVMVIILIVGILVDRLVFSTVLNRMHRKRGTLL